MRRILLCFVLAAAVAGPGVAGVDVAAAADAVVTFADRATPAALTVAPGTRVTFVNQSGERRRVRSDGGPDDFDSGNLEPGATWSVVLQAAGTYPYVDDRHRDDAAYRGTVTVASAAQPSGGSPETPPAPSPSPAPSAPVTAAVAILDRSFSPATVTVAPGGTVSWTNQSGRDHTVSAAGFDSAVLGGGGRFAHTFPSAGTYSYACEIHPEMRGTVTVGSGTGPPPPAPPPAPTASSPAPAPSPAPAVGAAPPAPGTAGKAPATRHTITVVDYAFQPAALSARVGDTVVWTNQGRAPHTATAPGVFDTGMVRAGEQRTTTLPTAGTFTFGCTIHPEMTGTVRVAAATGAAGGSAPVAGTDAGSTAGPTAPTAPGEPVSEAPAEPAAPGSADVSVVDFAFEPATVGLGAGGTVTWRLAGAAPHTVSAVDGSFDSGMLQPGATFSHRFDEPGTYRYACAFHPQMTGTIEVGNAAPASTSGADDAGREQAAAPTSLAGSSESASVNWGAVLAGLLAVAALLAGVGTFLYGGSRMVLAGGEDR
jgi:plastocyanin